MALISQHLPARPVNNILGINKKCAAHIPRGQSRSGDLIMCGPGVIKADGISGRLVIEPEALFKLRDEFRFDRNFVQRDRRRYDIRLFIAARQQEQNHYQEQRCMLHRIISQAV